jgi:hypothetical protein
MPKFSKRHYEALALAIQSIPDKNGREWARLAIASTLARDNDRFDKERFSRACLPGANVRART